MGKVEDYNDLMTVNSVVFFSYPPAPFARFLGSLMRL